VQHRALLTISLGLIAGFAAISSDAQTARSGGNSAGSSTAQQVIAQMQQVAKERADAQADAAKAKQDLTLAQQEAQKLKAELEALRSHSVNSELLTRAQRESQQASGDLEKVRGTVNELTKQLHDATVQLRDSEAARLKLRSAASDQLRAHATCAQENAELASLTLDTLSRYERKFGRGEPLLGIGRARAQNLVDEYRSRVEDLRAQPPSGALGLE
jgi:chromosome segregation ATPase